MIFNLFLLFRYLDMEPFVIEHYTWNSYILPVIAFNYFAHYLRHFYWIINIWKEKRKSLQELCAEKHSSRQEWDQGEFCGPCETICSFYKTFTIYTWRHCGYCEWWVMASFPWLASQVSQEFNIEHFSLKGSASEQPRVVTALLTVCVMVIWLWIWKEIYSFQYNSLICCLHHTFHPKQPLWLSQKKQNSEIPCHFLRLEAMAEAWECDDGNFMTDNCIIKSSKLITGYHYTWSSLACLKNWLNPSLGRISIAKEKCGRKLILIPCNIKKVMIISFPPTSM